MNRMMTKDSAIAMEWALCFFPLKQFDWVRNNLQLLFSHLLDRDDPTPTRDNSGHAAEPMEL